jgi:hypothetical protein
LGPAIFVRYYREFVITGEVYVDYVDLGLKKLKKLVRYNREFVITEFVITEFDCSFDLKIIKILLLNYSKPQVESYFVIGIV